MSRVCRNCGWNVFGSHCQKCGSNNSYVPRCKWCGGQADTLFSFCQSCGRRWAWGPADKVYGRIFFRALILAFVVFVGLAVLAFLYVDPGVPESSQRHVFTGFFLIMPTVAFFIIAAIGHRFGKSAKAKYSATTPKA